MINKLTILVGLLLTATTSIAQTGAFLGKVNDARALSMGSITTTSDASAFSIFTNMASTAHSESVASVGINYMNWQPSALNVNSLSLGAYIKPFEKIAFGIGVRYGMHDAQDIVGNTGDIIGDFKPHDLAIDLGVSYYIFDGFSAAVNVRYIESKIESAATAFAADIQFMYKLDRLNLGLTVNNIGTLLDDRNMLSNAKLGASYSCLKSDIHSLITAVEGGYVFMPTTNTSAIASAGVEYGWKSKLFARAGYSYGSTEKYIPSHFSCGLGIGLYGAKLDVAYILPTESSPIDNSFSVNISWTL